MSFVKKAVKKVTKFVKKHWKTILLVAATVFTAGLATVGFAGFASVASTQGFLSAVGSTMWAGTTAIAGSFGIGSGASGSAASAVGLEGAGFGASAGLGGGAGLGKAGATYAANAAAHAAGSGAVYSGLPGAVAGVSGGAGAGTTALTAGGVQSSAGALAGSAASGAATGGAGLSVATALDFAGKAAPVIGAGVTAFAKAREAEAANAPPVAVGGVDVGRDDPEYYANIHQGRYDPSVSPSPEAPPDMTQVGGASLPGAGVDAGLMASAAPSPMAGAAPPALPTGGPVLGPDPLMDPTQAGVRGYG